MKNCLTEAEGSAWKAGDDKPRQQYMFEKLIVTFICNAAVDMKEDAVWLFFNSELWGDFIHFLSNLLWLCKTVFLQLLFQHAKDSCLYNVNKWQKPWAVFWLLHN